MRTYNVTIHYKETDGRQNYCTIIRSDETEEDAKEYAINFFFKPEERHMIEYVEATCIDVE